MSDLESGLRSEASSSSKALSPSRTKAEPTQNDQVDVSKDFLKNTFLRMASAVPTRLPKVLPTIYKVPKEFKRGDEGEGYEPVAVRIGPFTKKNDSTAQLEKYKWWCMQKLMRWDQDHPNSDVTAELLSSGLKSMKSEEPDIRASYSEDIELSSDDLALNMLLDGCFILHHLRMNTRRWEREAQGIIDQDDPTLSTEAQDEKDDESWRKIVGRVCVWELVQIDLVLLENQIPFKVLIKLSDKDVLINDSLKLFRYRCPHMLRSSRNSATDYHGVDVHHLLHLFYLSIARPTRPSESESDNTSCWCRPKHVDANRQEAPVISPQKKKEAPVVDDVSMQWIPCAKELEEAGVKFRKRKEAKSFLDIKFNSCCGVLEIPQLLIDDFSDQLFRNLIAFEQTYLDTRCDITSYAFFMDCLIKTPEDMRILHRRGILVNLISGEQDASRFFSRICAQVRLSVDKYYLKNVMKKVNDYRGSRLHKWRAVLVRNYFSNPWVTMSVLAAVLLLGMTILQTFFTVYRYFKPPK